MWLKVNTGLQSYGCCIFLSYIFTSQYPDLIKSLTYGLPWRRFWSRYAWSVRASWRYKILIGCPCTTPRKKDQEMRQGKVPILGTIIQYWDTNLKYDFGIFIEIFLSNQVFINKQNILTSLKETDGLSTRSKEKNNYYLSVLFVWIHIFTKIGKVFQFMQTKIEIEI